MSIHFTSPRELGIATLLAAIVCLAAPVTASASYLYWAKTPVNSASVKTCMNFASSAMRSSGMQNIRVSAMEVAGERQGVYAAITCFNTAPQASAIAMAVGENGNETKQVSEELQRKIAHTHKLDDSQ